MPEIKRLKLKCDAPLSIFAFKFNLHRYIMAIISLVFADFFMSINNGQGEATPNPKP